MKTAQSIAFQVLGSAAILVVGFLGFKALMNLKPEPGETPKKDNLSSVKAEKVILHGEGVQLQVDGVVVPYREIPVPSEVSGRIVMKNEACRAGHFVTKGTVLAKIERRDFQLEVDRIQQELEQAKASLLELAVDIEGKKILVELNKREVALADGEWQRQKKLGRDVVSKSTLEKLERTKLTAELAEARTKNTLALSVKSKNRLERAQILAQKRLERAELDLARTEIRAPIDGVIVKDDVEADSFVQRGAALYMLEDTSRVEVRCNLQMDDLFWVWQSTGGKKRNAKGDYQLPVLDDVDVVYRFASRDSQNYTWKGRLDRFDGIGLDDQTRTAPCRVVVAKPRDVRVNGQPSKSGPPALVRGMFVSVKIRVKPKNVALLRVPEKALRPGKVVWKVDAKNELSIHPVRFIQIWTAKSKRSNGSSEILILSENGQVGAGDQLVTTPLSFVKTGMSVKVSK